MEMTKLQKAFVIDYVFNGGNATKAVASVGYSESSARQIASQLLGKPHIQEAIRKEQQRKLSGLGSKALSVIESILDDEKAPYGVRLDAAKTVLDRCGLSAQTAKFAPLEYEKPLEQMSIEELEAFISDSTRKLKEIEDEAIDGELVN